MCVLSEELPQPFLANVSDDVEGSQRYPDEQFFLTLNMLQEETRTLQEQELSHVESEMEVIGVACDPQTARVGEQNKIILGRRGVGICRRRRRVRLDCFRH